MLDCCQTIFHPIRFSCGSAEIQQCRAAFARRLAHHRSSVRPSALSFLLRICRTLMPAPSAPSVTSRKSKPRGSAATLACSLSKSRSNAFWYALRQGDRDVGHMTCGAWSPRAGSMIGFALVGVDIAVGDKLDVIRGSYRDPATLCPLPFF